MVVVFVEIQILFILMDVLTTKTKTMETEMNLSGEPELFNELELQNYQDASVGQRFLNWLIDAIIMQYGLSFATTYILARILVAISPQTAYDLFVTRQTNTDLILYFYLMAIINYLIYYTFCEKLFRGYTLGKLVTGTRAIREDGQELTFSNAILRSLSRLVPFEAFSAFGGHPWHDGWTNTRVIKSR